MMRKILFSMIASLTIAGCSGSDNKKEYIDSVTYTKSLVDDYNKEYNLFSTDMIESIMNDFSKVDSYRKQHQSRLLQLENKASIAISQIDKLVSMKYKSYNMNKLFQGIRHDINDGLYLTKYERNSTLYSVKSYEIASNQLKYFEQYNFEFRRLIN